MGTTIITKNGSGAPAASDLVAGELAVDLTNKRLYTEDSGANILELGSNPSTIVVAGTSTLTGNVTASNDLSVGGNLTVTGDATIEGNLTFGNAATDTITLGADVASHIVPSADDTYDLGATASRWRDIYIDGTAYLDAINFNGTAITATAAELNILDGVTSTAAELNILDGVTSTAAELNILDGVTSTAAELNLLDGVTATTAELNYLDVTTLGTVEASKAVTADANADVLFGDSDKLVFGAGSDLQIYHDGSQSIIRDAGTGNFFLRGENIYVQNSDGSANYLAGVGNEASLYYIGDKKLATTSTGIDVTGVITTDGMTTSGNVDFGDSDIARFGDGNDLQIYHDGANSYIEDAGTGNLFIRGTNLILEDAGGNDYIVMTDTGTGGTVAIKHNAATKLTTTSTGIDVTGTVTADGLTVDGIGSFSSTAPYIDLFETDTTDVNSRIVSNSSSLRLQTVGDDGTGASNRLLIDHTTGDISFYEDTATTAKFFWDASAESLGIGTSSPAQTLHLKSADPVIRLEDSSPDGVYAQIDGAGGGLILSADGGNGSASSFIGFRVDGTASGSEKMRIDSSGNVGIGLTPSAWSTGKAVELGFQGNALWGNAADEVIVSQNAYYNSGWKYATTRKATHYSQYDAAHRWFTAPSGTADAAITWTQAMTLDASGNLLLGKTADDFGTAGAAISQLGEIQITNASATPLYVRRNAVGELVGFYQSTTAVGSIGVLNTNNLTVGGSVASHGGIQFGTENVTPMVAGSEADAGADLGAHNLRWRDLYLSDDIISSGASSPALNLTDTTNDCNLIVYAQNTTANVGTYSNHALLFDTNSTERMRIRSDGNVLIGKTADDNTTAGIRFHNAGYASFTIANDYPIIANRLTSDGDIAVFRKDGTTVGSIGTQGSSTYIAGASSGLRFAAANIMPANASGAFTDNTSDLGGSTERFKDLYLSGGVYVGGTGADNYLDDYEEGTFTPTYTISGATITHDVQTGRYTKVGQVVHFQMVIGTDAATGSFSTSDVTITGFPFTASSEFQSGATGVAYDWASELDDPVWVITADTSTVILYENNNSAPSVKGAKFGTAANNNRVYITGSYRAA